MGKKDTAVELPMGKPACYDSQGDWDRWRESADQLASLGNNFNPKNFCADCQLSRQTKMVAANRCAYPDVKFVDAGNGGLYGRRAIIRIHRAEK